MNSIQINPSLVSSATLSFIRGYNTGNVKSDSIEASNVANLQAIGYHTIASQLTIVLATATFSSPQTKQTFKVSCQRYFAKVFSGKALAIKGNTVTIAIIQPGQVVNVKGRIVNAPTEEETRLAKEKADKKAALLLNAEQTAMQLDSANEAKKQAEATAASLAKKQREFDSQLKAEKEKAASAADVLSARVAELERQLAYAKHETVHTVKAYNELKAMILGKTTIQALREKVTGLNVNPSKPEFTAREVVQMVAQA